MNQACVRNDTIDAGNHHGRPQYRSFLRFLTSQERNVIWLLLPLLSSGGRHHARPVRAVLVTNQSGAVRRVLPMQLAATAHRSQPVPANVPPTGGLHNPVHPGMLKFGIHLNAAFMSITGLLGVLATWVRSPLRSTSNAFRGVRHCGFSSHHTGFPSEWASCNGCPSVCTPNR